MSQLVRSYQVPLLHKIYSGLEVQVPSDYLLVLSGRENVLVRIPILHEKLQLHELLDEALAMEIVRLMIK